MPRCRTRIEKHAHDAILIAQKQHRIEAALPRQHVAGVRDLRFVTDEEPPATEDAVLFEVKTSGSAKMRPRDHAFVRSNDVSRYSPLDSRVKEEVERASFTLVDICVAMAPQP
jgi:hypothetical protein